jgi:peptidoglycan/xylan/chitin deacetylase (PgdA/CDA1 family)
VSLFSAKMLLAGVLDGVGASRVLLALQRALIRPHVRVVNYHDVPPSRAAAFEAQVKELARHYAPVHLDELTALMEGRRRPKQPGIVFSFDDGLRSHADVVRPILDRYGMIGWFMVPVGFVETAPDAQRKYAAAHQIVAADEFGDARVALSWDDVRKLDGSHVVGCHTWHHTRLAATLNRKQLDFEIGQAKRRMERQIGHEVRVFCWVGGEEWSYSARAAAAIRNAGFDVALMTNSALVRPGTNPLQVQRTNLEADFSPALVRFQLSGVQDVLYTAKRLRVNRLTDGAPARARRTQKRQSSSNRSL